MIRVSISEAAARAIVEQADYFLQAANQALELRWESSVDDAVRSLLKMPERGAPCRFQSPSLDGLRWIFVPGFPKHLLFYRYNREAETILVVHVIHGSRDLRAILHDDL